MPPIADGQISSKILKDIGDLGCGYIRFAVATNVADTVTIGGTEVWTATAGGAGAGEYDQSGGTTASCATSLGAKINALPGSLVRAVVDDSTVFVFAKLASQGNLALAESTASARTVVSAAAQTGALAARVTQMSIAQYALTAENITALDPAGVAQKIAIAAFATTTEPKLLGSSFRTAAGEFYSPAGLLLDLVQSGANEWVLQLEDNNVAGVLSNTDIVTALIGF